MTDESAKLLAEALTRFAAAIERLAGLGSMGGGIHIYHHGEQPTAPWRQPDTGTPPWRFPTTW